MRCPFPDARRAFCAVALLLTIMSAHASEWSVYTGVFEPAATASLSDSGSADYYAGLALGDNFQFNEFEYGVSEGLRHLAFYSTFQVPLFADHVHALVGLGFASLFREEDDFWQRVTPDVALVKGGLNARLVGPLYVEALLENSYFGPERPDYKLQLRWKFQ